MGQILSKVENASGGDLPGCSYCIMVVFRQKGWEKCVI